MICARCNTPNPTSADVCSRCGSGLYALDDGATLELTKDDPLPDKADFGPRYEILAVLGSGGMGKVYKAHDRELDRIVALKVLRPDLMADPQALQRFKQELILARSISHPNILRIHDLGEYNAIKFISMAYVDGGDLTQLLKNEGRLPPERAGHIMQQLCEALGAAHTANVIHRDLKPQNILLGRNDHVYVSDFGVAKTLESDRTRVTHTGAVLGTPLYMSPEQVEAKPVDRRSDLYSLGLIFYEMLTGILPFSGDSTFQLMYQRVHTVPRRPELVNPDLPPYLSRICLRCLEKDPAMRYQSAVEILEDLRQKLVTAPHSRTVQITVPVFNRKHWVLSASALTLVVLLSTLAVPRVRHIFFASKGGAVSSNIPSLQEGKFVAVLPIRVLGNDPSLTYVADGLGEALSAKLFQFHDVHTTSTSDVQKLTSIKSVDDVAHRLGVNLVVSGTIQGSGDKLRIVTSLDNAATGKRVWTQEFSGMQQDLLTLEDQIYAGLVDALSLKPTNEEMARATPHPTENIEAYDLYLKGRSAMRSQQDMKNVQAAIDYYEQALKKDPGFALAYTGIADAGLVMYHEKKDSFWSQKALAAAEQAERLNETLPEVHFSLGSVYAATGKAAEAVAELRRALQLAPNSDEGYRRLGATYLANGRKDQAIQAFQKAVDLNPYYWVNHNALGGAYAQSGENEKALLCFRRVTELEPNNSFGYANAGIMYFQEGKYEECIRAFQQSLQLQPNFGIYSNIGTAYFYLKRYDDAVKMFEKAVDMNPNQQVAVGNLADAYRLAGQQDRAQMTYDKAIALAFKDLEVNPRDSATMAFLALYYARKGDMTRAVEFIHRARSINQADVNLIYKQAIVDALADRRSDALSDLQTAFQKGYSVEEAETEPDFASLRKDPQFQRLIDKFRAKPR